MIERVLCVMMGMVLGGIMCSSTAAWLRLGREVQVAIWAVVGAVTGPLAVVVLTAWAVAGPGMWRW